MSTSYQSWLESEEARDRIDARREDALLRATAAGLDLIYEALEEQPEPPCDCYQIDVDLVDAGQCLIHGSVPRHVYPEPKYLTLGEALDDIGGPEECPF